MHGRLWSHLMSFCFLQSPLPNTHNWVISSNAAITSPSSHYLSRDTSSSSSTPPFSDLGCQVNDIVIRPCLAGETRHSSTGCSTSRLVRTLSTGFSTLHLVIAALLFCHCNIFSVHLSTTPLSLSALLSALHAHELRSRLFNEL